LLVAAWLFAPSPYALAAAVAAVLAWVGTPRLKPNEARWIEYGALSLVLLASLWRVASNLTFTEAHYFAPTIPPWMRDTMSVVHDGSLPIALMFLTAWLAGHRLAYARHALRVLALAELLGVALLAPQAVRSWTARDFPEAHVAQFAAWRLQIPPQATVLWPESPLGVWLLLDRPSYLSVLQTSGMVFSRAGAGELERRADAIGTALSPRAFLDFGAGTSLNPSRDQLVAACGTRAFDYLVTGADLGMKSVAPTVPAAGPRTLKLYRCSR
jgi:hypothetical protein